MFIQTQPTPNPTSLMFMPGQAVMEVRAFRSAALTTVWLPWATCPNACAPRVLLLKYSAASR